MKRGKRLLAILLVLILSVSMAGCSKFAQQNQSASDTTSSKRITHEDVKKKVINEASEYLKKNYPDDNFTFVSAASPNWADNYYKVGFKTEKYNNQQVMVYGSSSDKKDEDGFTIYTYSDDYYQYYMKDDAEKYFYDLSKKYLGEDIVVKVTFAKSIGFTKSIKREKTFSQNLKDDSVTISLYIFSEKKQNEIKDDFELLLNCLINNKIYISVSYLCIDHLFYIENKDINYIINNFDRYNIEMNDYSTYKGIIKEY